MHTKPGGASFLLLVLLALVRLQHHRGLLHLPRGLEQHPDGSDPTYLVLQQVLVLEHVHQLRVVDLEQHAGDLAGQVGEHALDEWEEPRAEHQ